MLHRCGKAKRAADRAALLRSGTEKQVSDRGAVHLHGTGKRVVDLGAVRLRGMEKLVVGQVEPLHFGREKRACARGAVLLPDMARRASVDYSGKNMVTPSRPQIGIGSAGIGSAGNELACRAHVLRESLVLQSVHVFGAPSRDGQRPSLRVCDVCPPRVAYLATRNQHRDKWT